MAIPIIPVIIRRAKASLPNFFFEFVKPTILLLQKFLVVVDHGAKMRKQDALLAEIRLKDFFQCVNGNCRRNVVGIIKRQLDVRSDESLQNVVALVGISAEEFVATHELVEHFDAVND